MKKGFTLIEIMVAVSIFAVVMVISAGSILSILDANAKSQSLKSVMNNINLALEGMSRAIRMGSSYHCGNTGNFQNPNDCTTGATFFVFEPTGGDKDVLSDQVVYRLREGRIERSLNGGTTYSTITAPGVVVQDLKFYVTGSSINDTLSPKVVMTVRGYAGVKEKVKTNFSIQTTVSQRYLDTTI